MEELCGPCKCKRQRLQSCCRRVLNQRSARDDSAQEVCCISHRVVGAYAELMLRKGKTTPLTLMGWMAVKSVDAAALRAEPSKFIRKSKGFRWIEGNGGRILEGAQSQRLLVAGEQTRVMSRQGNQGETGRRGRQLSDVFIEKINLSQEALNIQNGSRPVAWLWSFSSHRVKNRGVVCAILLLKTTAKKTLRTLCEQPQEHAILNQWRILRTWQRAAFHAKHSAGFTCWLGKMEGEKYFNGPCPLSWRSK